MTRTTVIHVAAVTLSALAVTMCGSGSSSPASPTATTSSTSTSAGTSGTTANLPAAYAQFGDAATVSVDGSTIVIRTTAVPDHRSPYFGTGHASYEAPHAGMQVNPHRIAAQNIVFRIPAAPSMAAPSDTPLGPIGVAVNGVVFFNQYAAMRMPLTNEILSFDRFNGHPSPSNQYHYHVEPLWLTESRGRSAFLGVLLDGYPVYGTTDASGTTPTDLDSCNGHTGATAEYPAGVYHYHVTSAPPYISGCFRGSPGTVAG